MLATKPAPRSSVRAARPRWADRNWSLLAPIVLLSFALNVWGNVWGAPNFWHPDELTPRAIEMAYARDLNPRFYIYGNQHYHNLIFGAFVPVKAYERVIDPRPPDMASAAGMEWRDRHTTRIIRTARALSAAFGALIVTLTFLIGSILFGRAVGAMAAVALALTPYFVGISHFATVDIPANFWYWLACFLALLVWKRGGPWWYASAALVAGIAFGTKADRLLVLFPLIVSHLLRGEGIQLRRLLGYGMLVPVGFVLANPTLLASPFEFLDGFTREMFFSTLREPSGGAGSYLLFFEHLYHGLGAPLFVLSTGAIGFGLLRLRTGPDRAAFVWLLATFLPYYVVFGTQMVPAWYVVIFFPALMLLTAYAGQSAVRRIGRGHAVPLAVAGVGVLGFTLLTTVAVLLQFSNDSRYLASAWIEQHAPAGASIAALPRGPVLPREGFQLIGARSDPLFWEAHLDWPAIRAGPPIPHSLPQILLLQPMRARLGSGRLAGDGWWPTLDPPLERFDATLDQLIAEADKLAAALHFAFLPTHGQFVDPSLTPRYRDEVLAAVRARGVLVVDFEERLRETGDPLHYFPFRKGAHYTEEGYALLVAQILERVPLLRELVEEAATHAESDTNLMTDVDGPSRGPRRDDGPS